MDIDAYLQEVKRKFKNANLYKRDQKIVTECQKKVRDLAGIVGAGYEKFCIF